MLRLLGPCCLGKVDLPMAGGAVSCKCAPSRLPICPLPLRSLHPPQLLAVCCFYVFAKMGATRTASGRLELNLFLSEKRGREHSASEYCCLSLKADEVVLGFMLQGLGQWDSAGRVRLDDEQSCMHSCIENLKNLHSQPFAAAYIRADKAGF